MKSFTHKATNTSYVVLHEGTLISLKRFCEIEGTRYRTVLMRVWRWHKAVDGKYLFFDMAIPDDREILSKEHYTIGTPDYVEKNRRKNAAIMRIARSKSPLLIQYLQSRLEAT